MMKANYFKHTSKGRIDLVDQHSVYQIAWNGIVRNCICTL